MKRDLISGSVRIPGDDPFNGNANTVFETVKTLYIFGIVTLFISALGNRPQGSKWLYYGNSCLFSLLMGLMIFMGAFAVKTSYVHFLAGI